MLEEFNPQETSLASITEDPQNGIVCEPPYGLSHVFGTVTDRSPMLLTV